MTDGSDGSCRLSFYKESLAGETDNLIHLRAAAEQKDPLSVLREVVEETLESIRKVEMLTAADPQLAKICRSYVVVSADDAREEERADSLRTQGYVEFHFRARRYRLEDLGMEY